MAAYQQQMTLARSPFATVGPRPNAGAVRSLVALAFVALVLAGVLFMTMGFGTNQAVQASPEPVAAPIAAPVMQPLPPAAAPEPAPAPLPGF